jgi:hypothetical protein
MHMLPDRSRYGCIFQYTERSHSLITHLLNAYYAPGITGCPQRWQGGQPPLELEETIWKRFHKQMQTESMWAIFTSYFMRKLFALHLFILFPQAGGDQVGQVSLITTHEKTY